MLETTEIDVLETKKKGKRDTKVKALGTSVKNSLEMHRENLNAAVIKDEKS